MIDPDIPPSPQLIERLRQRCDRMYFFTRYMFYARRRYHWLDNWHHELICDKLEEVVDGKIKRLIINCPPRYSKTDLAVVNFIPWCLGQYPDAEFIHTSYSARLASNNSFNAKSIVELPEYRHIYPHVELRGDSKAKDEWGTTVGGKVYATGSGGSLTGYGAGKFRSSFGGAILIDDPSKPDEITSDVMRQNVIDWFDSTLQSRCNSPDTPIILIMQRLHENDLAGWLLNGGNGEHWDSLIIPVINEQDEALWPAKHDRERLRQMELANPYMFSGQYMQRPAPAEGGIWKKEWWRYWSNWTHQDRWPRFSRIVQSWDTAFKTGQQNDYSICTTWGEASDGFYLIDIFRRKMEAPDLRKKAVEMAQRFNPTAILIEDKASGQGLIQDLRTFTRLPVIAVQVNKDKVTRSHEVTPQVEAGRVFLPENHPEVAIFVHEHALFPNGNHDDTVDSTTQALKYLTRAQPMQFIQLSGI